MSNLVATSLEKIRSMPNNLRPPKNIDRQPKTSQPLLENEKCTNLFYNNHINHEIRDKKDYW